MQQVSKLPDTPQHQPPVADINISFQAPHQSARYNPQSHTMDQSDHSLSILSDKVSSKGHPINALYRGSTQPSEIAHITDSKAPDHAQDDSLSLLRSTITPRAVTFTSTGKATATCTAPQQRQQQQHQEVISIMPVSDNLIKSEPVQQHDTRAIHTSPKNSSISTSIQLSSLESRVYSHASSLKPHHPHPIHPCLRVNTTALTKDTETQLPESTASRSCITAPALNTNTYVETPVRMPSRGYTSVESSSNDSSPRSSQRSLRAHSSTDLSSPSSIRGRGPARARGRHVTFSDTMVDLDRPHVQPTMYR